jgi:hypothetical protein
MDRYISKKLSKNHHMVQLGEVEHILIHVDDQYGSTTQLIVVGETAEDAEVIFRDHISVLADGILEEPIVVIMQ